MSESGHDGDGRVSTVNQTCLRASRFTRICAPWRFTYWYRYYRRVVTSSPSPGLPIFRRVVERAWSRLHTHTVRVRAGAMSRLLNNLRSLFLQLALMKQVSTAAPSEPGSGMKKYRR